MDSRLDRELEEWIRGQEDERPGASAGWRERLREMGPYLRMELPIGQVERIEQVLKRLLREVLAQPLDGDAARAVAQAQRDLGFVLKFKSYAVKCASPLGYSVFLQNPHEGFSFQRHVTRKTEVFHILEPLAGARVFLCSSAEWEAAYARERMTAWLGGAADAALERHAIVPAAGDVFHVDRLGVVHTVLGCVLEEFATVSTDMVERLHDQNAGRPVALSERKLIEDRLRRLPVPEGNAEFGAGREAEGRRPLPAPTRDGVRRVPLSSGVIEAARYAIEPGCTTACERDGVRATQLFVLRGRGELLIGDEGELRRGLPPMAIQAGDLLLVPPGIHRMLRAAPDEALAVSEHGVAPAVALD